MPLGQLGRIAAGLIRLRCTMTSVIRRFCGGRYSTVCGKTEILSVPLFAKELCAGSQGGALVHTTTVGDRKRDGTWRQLGPVNNGRYSRLCSLLVPICRRLRCIVVPVHSRLTVASYDTSRKYLQHKSVDESPNND